MSALCVSDAGASTRITLQSFLREASNSHMASGLATVCSSISSWGFISWGIHFL
jgi:hypothetical protein